MSVVCVDNANAHALRRWVGLVLVEEGHVLHAVFLRLVQGPDHKGTEVLGVEAVVLEVHAEYLHGAVYKAQHPHQADLLPLKAQAFQGLHGPGVCP